MSIEIVVIAIMGGWLVEASFSSLPLVFISGARAEETARALARAAAGAGSAVELRVQTRDGKIAARRHYG